MRNVRVLIVLSLLLLVLTSGCIDPAMTHLKQGDTYAAQGDIEQAIEEYSKAIELNPNLALAYSSRGVAYVDTGQWALALVDLNKSIELDPQLTTGLSPKLAVAYSNRGHEYNTRGQYDLAVDYLTKAIEFDPDSATARIYADRGKAYLETDQKELARNDYNRAIELDPQLLTAQELADIMYHGCSQATTFSMDIDMDIEATTKPVISGGSTVASFTGKMKISGVVDDANKRMRVATSMWIDIPGQGKQEFMGDMYVVDGWAYFNTEDEDWFKMEFSDASWSTQDMLSEQRELLKTATDITLLGSEKIDGVDCYALLFEPDIAALPKVFKDLPSQQQQTGTDFSEYGLSKALTKVEIKAWVTKAEYLPVQIDLNLNMNYFETAGFQTMPKSSGGPFEDMNFLMVSGKMQMKFRDYNKPVVIELPPEALKAKGIIEIYTGR